MQACISTQSAAAAPAVQTFCTPSTLYRPTGRGTDGFLLCVCSCLPRIAGAAVPCPALSVAAALRYLHEEAGIAHGDVKGRNVLLGSRDAQLPKTAAEARLLLRGEAGLRRRDTS